MNLSEFLKNIRRDFDPYFRYIVLARETSAGDIKVFSDVLKLIGADGPAVIDSSFHYHEASGTSALVIKLRPYDSSSIDKAIVSGKLPEDVVFYIYENLNRLYDREPHTLEPSDEEIHK